MSDRRLRILQVARRFFPEQGGMETHVAEISTRLAARPDFDITVLATDRSGSLPRSETIGGYQVVRRRSWPAERDYYISPGIAPVIARGGWDVVHVQGVNTMVPIIAMAAAAAARVPFVLSMHSGGHSSELRNAGRNLQWKTLAPLLRRSQRLIAVGRFEREYFAAATGIPESRFSLIPNGGALPPSSKDVHPVPGRIVSSGRLERYKGHHRVVEALPLIRRQRPDAHLQIIGSGDYKDELVALATRLGVDDVVSYRSLPPDDRAAMSDALAGAGVMAALSSYEAHPIGVMEALAIGLPVVGLAVAGIGDLVEDGAVTGVPADAGTEVIAEELVRALNSTAARGDVPHSPGSITLPALPTWESSTEQLAAIYHEVAGTRVPAR